MVFPIPNASSSNHINVLPYSVLYHKSPLVGDDGASLPILTLPLPPPPPPPLLPAILISTVFPYTANVLPAPIKFNIVNPYPTTAPAVLIPTPLLSRFEPSP